MNRRVIYCILIFTTLGLVFSGSSTSSSSRAYAQSTSSTPSMFVLGGEDKLGAVEIDLRAVQQGTQIRQIKTFDVTIDNVVQAKQGGSITAFSSDPSLKIVKAKVRTDTAIENLRELPRTQGNTFSLIGLVSGVYILDIIAQKDNRDLAYETILVILDPGETTITANLQIINNVITKVKNNVRTEVVFRDGNGDRNDGSEGGGGPNPNPSPNPRPIFAPDKDCAFNPALEKCKPPEGQSCPDGFWTNEDGQCFPEGDCPNGYGRLDDDESGKCYKDKDIKTCPDGYITHEDYDCPEEGPEIPIGSIEEPVPETPVEELPPCDSVTAGTTCDDTASEDSTLDEPVEEFAEEEVGEGIETEEEPFVIEDIEEETEEFESEDEQTEEESFESEDDGEIESEGESEGESEENGGGEDESGGDEQGGDEGGEEGEGG